MAYNKSNYYKKIIKIEEQFNISSRTYRTYLGIPAKRELKKLQEMERLKGQQLTFNF